MARPKGETKPIDLNKVPGFNFIYAGRNGDIFNGKTGKFLKPYKMKKGHLQVSISINGIVKKYLAHRLVALTYVENKYSKPCVNHINGKPYDNRADNLEWCTDNENKAHAKKNGLYQQSTNRYNARFDHDEIMKIHRSSMTHSDLAREFNVSQSVITRIKNFKTYKNYEVIIEKDGKAN